MQSFRKGADHIAKDKSGLQTFKLYSTRSRVRELASGMRQLAGTKTRYRRAHAAPVAGLISGRVEYKKMTDRNVHPTEQWAASS